MSLRNMGGILAATKTGLNTPVERVEYLVVAGGGGGSVLAEITIKIFLQDDLGEKKNVVV